MTIVTIHGWKPGFQKVNFTFLLQRELGYSLRTAKLQTDAIMDDRAVELQVPGDAEGLLKSLDELGAKFDVAVSAGR